MQETHEKGIASRRYKPASGCLPLGHGRVTGVRSEKSGLYIVFVCFAHFVVCAAASVCSASTSQNYTASDVLTAMGVPAEQIKGALRLSWCHERARLQLPRARSSPDARGAVGRWWNRSGGWGEAKLQGPNAKLQRRSKPQHPRGSDTPPSGPPQARWIQLRTGSTCALACADRRPRPSVRACRWCASAGRVSANGWCSSEATHRGRNGLAQTRAARRAQWNFLTTKGHTS